ncbi:MAG: SMP-30/gluconolactonase/LRE family protein, partial [Bacteriovoracaceae bacterium]|nr:SMP-30/gluconolactonase/LRE family protein [Bacteriovoracaceae bacterium]
MKYIAGFVAILLVLVFKTLVDANVFKDFAENNHESCQTLLNLQGVEDIDSIDDEIILSSAYFPPFYDMHKNPGALYLYNHATKKLTNLTKSISFEFYPHGIYFFKTNNKKILFVINHTTLGDRIERFELVDEKLTNYVFYQTEELYNANDIVGVDENRFYVTVTHGARSHMGMFIENFSQLGRGYVLYYDGAKFTKVIDRLSFANGIEYQDSTKQLYLSQMVSKKVGIYSVADFL